MTRFFEDFTDEELKRFKEVFGDNAEYNDDRVLLHQPDGFYDEITFLKHDDDFYVEHYEEDAEYYEMENRVYLLDTTWWEKVNMEQILADYENGQEIDPNEYSLD